MTRWANLSKKDAKRLGLEGMRELDQMEKKEKQQTVKKMTVKKYKKDNAPSEYEEQIKLAKYLDMNGYCWNHVPNGGNRDARTGAKMKRQGAKKGFPDVQIFDAPDVVVGMIGRQTKMCRGIIIELKRSNGVPSDVSKEQKNWLDKLEDRYWLTKVAYGADDAIDWLEGLEW